MSIRKTKFVVVVTSWGKEGNPDHGVGAGTSTVFIFDMSIWVVVGNQVGMYYTIPFLDFFIKNSKRWRADAHRSSLLFIKSFSFLHQLFSASSISSVFQLHPVAERPGERERERRRKESCYGSRETRLREIDKENTFPYLNLLVMRSDCSQFLSFFLWLRYFCLCRSVWQLPLGVVLSPADSDTQSQR